MRLRLDKMFLVTNYQVVPKILFPLKCVPRGTNG